ncbi:MAG: guanylate kinase [Chlamydiota bacterium]
MTQKVLGNLSRGLVFVLSAPAGTGKTTLVRMLTQEFDCIEESVSSTTRAPRVGEVDGKDYFFLTSDDFKKKVVDGEFLEYAEVYGQLYGTSKKHLEEKLNRGNHIFLVIDTQGALSLRKMDFKAVYIFVSPPNVEALRERLYKRQTEDEDKRTERLSWAEKEMKQSVMYDFRIVNCKLDVAYTVLKSIVIAEEHRVEKS